MPLSRAINHDFDVKGCFCSFGEAVNGIEIFPALKDAMCGRLGFVEAEGASYSAALS